MNRVYDIELHGRSFGFQFYDLPQAEVHPSRHVVFRTTQPFSSMAVRLQGLSTSKYNHVFKACNEIPPEQLEIIKVEDSFIIPSSPNFYHLMVDSLPRLYGAFLERDQKITICKTILDRYPRIYSLLKSWIPCEKWIEIEIDLDYNKDGNDRIIKERMRGNFRVFASTATDEAKILRSNRALAVAFWQKWYASHHEQQKMDRYVFLARTPGPGGSERCINQKAVFEELCKHRDFEWVDPMEHEFADLAKIINGAHTIVGVHGAGMTNTVFCQPGTRYIQLSNNSGSELFYETIASHCLADYSVLHGADPVTGDPVFDNKSGTYVIEPKEILKLLGAE